MLISCVPQVYASELEYWLIDDFPSSSEIRVTGKKCIGGIITITGTDLIDEGGYITATAYKDAANKSSSTLVAMAQSIPDKDGNFEITMGIKEGTQSAVIDLCGGSEIISAAMELHSGNSVIDKLEKMSADLDALADKCVAAGIPVDYAMVNVRIVDKFTQFLREDLINGDDSRISEQYEVICDAYTSAKSELESYLDGTKIPEDVPRYVTSNLPDENQGTMVISNAEYEGEISRRPTFYVGYVGWDYAESSVDYFDDLGVNYLHMEASPSSILLHPDVAKDWEYIGGGYLAPGSAAVLTPGVGRNGGSAVSMVNTTVPDSTPGATHPYGVMGIRQTVNVIPNTTYNFNFYVKGTGINSQSYYQVGTSPRQRFATSYDDYTKLSYSYTTAADETSVNVIIAAENENSQLLIDDVSLVQRWTSTNLISNPGFEGGEADTSSLREGFKINYDELDRIKGVMKNAEDNNIAVGFLLALHNFPAFITAEDSDIDNSGKIYSSFIPINPTHPRVKEVLSLFATILMEEIGDSPALQSVVLANEPAFVSAHGGGGNPNYYYLPLFRQFLENKYGTISALNSAYSSSYSSFDAVNMPPWGNMRTAEKTKLGVDYIEFNDSIITELHTYLAEVVHKTAPNVKVNTKMMEYLAENTSDPINDRNTNGNNYEDVSKALDLNGHDGGAAKGQTGLSSIQSYLSWLDFSRSVKNKPSFNMEDHSMQGEIGGNNVDWIYGYLWQSAVHGRGGSALWLWDRTESILSGSMGDEVYTTRPAETASVGKASLDLNKYADKIQALQNKKARVALYYSHKTSYWSNNYLNALYRSYCDIIYTGQKVDYITEQTTSKINSGDYDVLVVPYALNVPQSLLNEIITFKNAGGKVVLTEYNDGSALAKDEYNNAHSSSFVNQARYGCEIAKYSSVGEWWNDDWRVYDANGEVSSKTSSIIRANVQDANVLQIIDTSTGAPITNAEYTYAEDASGDIIVNIYSFESSGSKNINIRYNGQTISSSYDILSENQFDSNVTLEAYKPLLLNITSKPESEYKVRINAAQAVGDGFEITDYNIDAPANGLLEASVEIPQGAFERDTEVACFIAVYENGGLVGCGTDKRTIKPSSPATTMTATVNAQKVSENTNVKVFIWDGSMKPLANTSKIGADF